VKIFSLVAIAGCAHHAAATLPEVCRGKADASACVGWAYDLAYVGAGDLRYDDRALEAYVNGVAQKIGRAAGMDRVDVRVLDGGDPEASALGGDIVYVDRGVLARLDDEAELAGLLGHEVTHLVAKHTADLVHSDEDSAMSDDERLRRRDDDEALADERAVEWTAAAGYDPSAVLSMMRAVERDDDGSEPAIGIGLDLTTPADDHPPSGVRLARIARLVAGRRVGVRRREEYLAHIDGVVVGDDPRRGRMENMTWIRARSGIALDVPKGWKLSDQSPLGFASPDGATLIVMPVDRSWLALITPMLTVATTRRIADRDVTIGVTMPSDDAGRAGPDDPKITVNADARGTPTALVDEGDHATMLVVTGTHAHAHLLALLGGLRAATEAELRGSAPKRLHLHAAPRAGTVAALAKLVCRDPAAGRAFDDPARMVAKGDPIKCVE
jgi:predicted Zn-dependent protease